MKNKSNNTILSIGEAADLLGVHIDTIRNWESKGFINPIKTPGGHRRYTKLEIQNFVKGRKIKTFIRIVSAKDQKEVLISIDHIWKIEISYAIKSGNNNWKTDLESAIKDPDSFRAYTIFYGDGGESTLISGNDPVMAVIENIYKNAVKG